LSGSAESYPALTVITDDALSPARIEAVVEAACHATAIVVQLRARAWSGRQALATAERLRVLTRKSGSRLVINDRIDVAIAVDADGIHLPAAGIAPARARALLDARSGRRMTLGVSIHSAEEISALDGLADVVHFGPVLRTPSKDALGPPQGVDALRRVANTAATLGRPPRIVAVGGITHATAAQVLTHGAFGVAVIRAVMAAAEPDEAVRALSAALRRART
jgi:thiamine-phosphate pyrophosphorylase